MFGQEDDSPAILI